MGIVEAVLFAISMAMVLGLFLVPLAMRFPGHKNLKCYCKHTAGEHSFTCRASDPKDYGYGIIVQIPCFCMRAKSDILMKNFWDTVLNRKKDK